MHDEDLAALTAAYDTLIAAEQGAGAVEFSTAHWEFHWQVLRPGSTNEIRRLLREAVADRRPLRPTDAWHGGRRRPRAAPPAATTRVRPRDGTTAATILEAHLHLTGDALRAELHHRGLE